MFEIQCGCCNLPSNTTDKCIKQAKKLHIQFSGICYNVIFSYSEFNVKTPLKVKLAYHLLQTNWTKTGLGSSLCVALSPLTIDSLLKSKEDFKMG